MSFDFLVVKLADTSCIPYLQLKYTSSEAASSFSEIQQAIQDYTAIVNYSGVCVENYWAALLKFMDWYNVIKTP